jgi:hypothetical protein
MREEKSARLGSETASIRRNCTVVSDVTCVALHHTYVQKMVLCTLQSSL